MKPSLLSVRTWVAGARGDAWVPMILDTGATATIIPPQIAIGIGCDPSKSERRVPIITASGLEYLPVIVIPEIACLGKHLLNFEVVCHTLPPQSTMEGLLGLDFLIHLPAYQQFHAEILRLTQG